LIKRFEGPFIKNDSRIILNPKHGEITMPEIITLKTLVVTFNDDTPDEIVEEVRDLLLHYAGTGAFIVTQGQDFEEVDDGS
jgi:bifunctional ADP-heptose synthase (sugar kinase/adenylyltransferase)